MVREHRCAEPIDDTHAACSECRCSKSDRPKPDLGPGKANYGLGRRSSHSGHSSCEAKGAALPFRVGTANSLRTAYLCCETDQCLAIDMAEVELEHGTDDETRDMAQKIIDAQKEDIAEMTAMLDRMGVEVPE